MVNEVAFLGYIIYGRGISVDQEKIRAMKTWTVPQTITEVRGFHGLTSFYRRFIKDFSSVVAPITECMRKGDFQWTEAAQQSFEKIKKLMCETPILKLPDFERLFKYKEGKQNVVANALSRRHSLLIVMSNKVLGFEFMKEMYKEDHSHIGRTSSQKEISAVERFSISWKQAVCTRGILQRFSDHGSPFRRARGTFWGPENPGDLTGSILLAQDDR
ncbi:putative mitochondrial protein AtMg00860 [Silene latifolia]|uniref:putative mitochondrial protein AtMg00860 n=1 Tax=Silene latifolia TaxID=37657 RepID=UPI003D77D10E